MTHRLARTEWGKQVCTARITFTHARMLQGGDSDSESSSQTAQSHACPLSASSSHPRTCAYLWLQSASRMGEIPSIPICIPLRLVCAWTETTGEEGSCSANQNSCPHIALMYVLATTAVDTAHMETQHPNEHDKDIHAKTSTPVSHTMVWAARSPARQIVDWHNMRIAPTQ